MTAPVAEREDMWQNFFWACALGTVVRAADGKVWQKRGKSSWQAIGASSEYSASSIAWPAEVLMGGIE